MSRTTPLSLIACLTLAGCATLKDSASQSVPFVSTPEGATILRDGVSVAQTPAYVEVSRRAPRGMALATRTGPRDVELKRHYRWGASFWSNLIFLWGAPVGWAVDLISGAASRSNPPRPPRSNSTRGTARPTDRSRRGTRSRRPGPTNPL